MRNRNSNVVGTTVYLTPRKSRNPKDRRPPQPIPFDVALRQFKKAVERAGIIQEVRKREYYEKPNQKKNRKKAEAVRRYERKRAKEKTVSNLPRSFRTRRSPR